MGNNHKRVGIAVANHDATLFDADVLVLKYAQTHFGLDLAISQKATRLGITENQFSPLPGVSSYFHSRGCIRSKNVLVVGVTRLHEFSYKEIRVFARTALAALADHERNEPINRVCFTLHGAGYGLDELEAFESEVAGLIDGITAGRIPKSVEEIVIVELDERRASRLKDVLRELIPSGYIETSLERYLQASENAASETFRSAGYSSKDKPHVFVAMPFGDEMEDVYEYGIQNAVRRAGFLCERDDRSVFAGDVVDWIKKRIRSASFVIADLTTANPNVYLEVGFAWGCGVTTVLLVKDTEQLKFDVRGQRCIVYKKIGDLEKMLHTELVGLKDKIVD